MPSPYDSIYQGMQTTGILREIFDRLAKLEATVNELRPHIKVQGSQHWMWDPVNEQVVPNVKGTMTMGEFKKMMGQAERVVQTVGAPVTENTLPTYYGGPETPVEEPHPATKTSFVLKI